ncbi:polysaccharide biosynthesis tyrosine autokinase [Acinetobacter radioresistens]|uniref:polysaccharide biosynthesis tyrosine autokinase n=1 Tax=Acinetobacter radioresistens TaxID=40216 RepID=UPI0021CDC99A|nr:polysaccharide biosynthesis tyrosine autokinase [Acinetobacter radioresistens]MCU4308162.1 polysaccharide biosynthesis tyrosine autokinase [Acinetobacter radioresistens]
MNSNSTPQEDTIDLKELFFALIAQWKLIALCMILSLVCALLYLRATPNTYQVDAMIQVEDSKGAGAAALLGELGTSLPGGLGGKSPADAEIEILNSRKVLGQTIQDLNLDIHIHNEQKNLMYRLLNEDQDRTLYKNNGVTWQNKKQFFVVQTLEVPQFYIDKPLTLKFLDNQDFSFSYKNEIVFTGKLNSLNQDLNDKGLWKIQIYTKSPLEQSFKITKLSIPSAVKWIKQVYSVAEKGKSSGIIGLNYNGADKAHITQVLNHILAIYQAQNIERKSLESAQTLSFLEKQLPELKQQLEESEIQFNRFREKYNTIDVTQEAELMLKQNIELEKLKIELQQQQAELSSKYTSDHPLMSAINAQLAEINQKTSEMTQAIKRLPETQRLYLQLYRDVKVNTELYTALLNSYQQLKIAKAGEIGNVRIIDTAIEPVEPIKPKKLVTLILAIFVGAFLGTLLALLRNMMRTGIKDAAQIENELNLPVYATVPRSTIQESRIKLLKKKKNIPILAVKDSNDIAIESLRSMRTAIHFALASAQNNIIALSGPAPEIGKSFITINLATILAQSGKRVLVIDGDMRRGYMHKYFNAEVNPGLAELLNHQNHYEDVLQSSTVENLFFVTRGRSPVNPSELLSTESLKAFLDRASTSFDHVLIDTPPVLAVTDGIIIAQYAGVNLLIARHAKTQMKELEITVNRFEQAGIKVNGVILNDIQRTAAGYGYGYNYAYAYQAKKDD